MKLLLWGLLATLIAVATVIGSFLITLRARGVAHFVTSPTVLVLVGWSLWVLYRIVVLHVWASFLPHIAIVIAVGVTLVQGLLFRRYRK